MQIFLFTLLYIIIVALSIWMMFALNNLDKNVKEQKQNADNLEKQLYYNLRDVQYKAKNIIKCSKSLLKHKKSILGEAVSTFAITLLPFKKIKNLLYLKKLYERFL